MTEHKTATESELKFTLADDTAPALRAYLNQHMQAQPALLLSNAYFDTADGALHHQRIGCRIRRWTEQGEARAEQTVKLAGSSVNGLHCRPEYNLPLGKQQTPDLTSFAPEIWPGELDITRVNERLEEKFTVTFTRHRWHWDWSEKGQNATIEVVLDDGVIQAGALQEAIFEVELELISGTVAGLQAAGRELAQRFALQPCDISKAQRGFTLARQAG